MQRGALLAYNHHSITSSLYHTFILARVELDASFYI